MNRALRNVQLTKRTNPPRKVREARSKEHRTYSDSSVPAPKDASPTLIRSNFAVFEGGSLRAELVQGQSRVVDSHHVLVADDDPLHAPPLPLPSVTVLAADHPRTAQRRLALLGRFVTDETGPLPTRVAACLRALTAAMSAFRPVGEARRKTPVRGRHSFVGHLRRQTAQGPSADDLYPLAP
jgi:hypothetical protein